MKRVDAGDANGINNLGFYYNEGLYNLPQNYTKALECWEQAAELGNVTSYYNIGNAYMYGRGVERDGKKAIHYYELAATKGDVNARHNLGWHEYRTGNVERALKHYLMSARGGDNSSLVNIQKLYSKGHATKDDYTKALRIYQEYLNEVKSSQRDKAAAASEIYKYID